MSELSCKTCFHRRSSDGGFPYESYVYRLLRELLVLQATYTIICVVEAKAKAMMW